MPFEEHPVFRSPPSWQPIWRYMGFSKFAWMLETGRLHFHRIGDFPDPFEGTIPRAVQQLRKRSADQMAEEENVNPGSVEQDMRLSTKFGEVTIFVNSWHANKQESAAMWNQYGDADKTIAIQSTVQDLKSALEPIPQTVYVGSMMYVDFYSDWEDLSNEDKEKINRLFGRTEGMNTFYPALLKRAEFDYENELRAVFSDFENRAVQGVDQTVSDPIEAMEAKRDYYNLKVDLDKLVNSIYIAPDTPDWLAETVESVVSRSENDLTEEDVFPSEMDQKPTR